MDEVLVKDLMWAQPEVISPEATLQEAALRMTEADCGILGVGTNGSLEGVITDRDIVTRAVSRGADPKRERVRNCMTTGRIQSCREDDTIRQATATMQASGLTRLAVLNPMNQLAGIISLGHIVRHDAGPDEIADMISHINKRRDGLFAWRCAAAGASAECRQEEQPGGNPPP